MSSEATSPSEQFSFILDELESGASDAVQEIFDEVITEGGPTVEY